MGFGSSRSPRIAAGCRPSCRLSFGSAATTDLVLSKVVLRVERAVAPVFLKPTGESPKGHFSTTLAGADVPELGLNALYWALSVASGCSIRPTVEWDALLDYEIFDLRPGRVVGTRGSYSSSPYVGLLRSPGTSNGTLTEDGLRDAQKLYRELAGLDRELREQLQIPIERWMSSLEQWEPVDRTIDLGVGLESLYMSGIRDELRFRFALRAAWHLADGRADRIRLFDTFKKIYDLRSNAVHQGRLDRTVTIRDQTSKTSGFVKEAQELRRKAICKVIRSAKRPDWNELVLGQSQAAPGWSRVARTNPEALGWVQAEAQPGLDPPLRRSWPGHGSDISLVPIFHGL